MTMASVTIAIASVKIKVCASYFCAVIYNLHVILIYRWYFEGVQLLVGSISVTLFLRTLQGEYTLECTEELSNGL